MQVVAILFKSMIFLQVRYIHSTPGHTREIQKSKDVEFS